MNTRPQNVFRFTPLVVSLLVPFVTHGAAVDRFHTIACTIRDWVYTFALVVGIIFVLVAAYKFMSAGGDESAVSEARKTLTYAVVGIAVALVAGSVPSVVGSLIGEDPGNACP